VSELHLLQASCSEMGRRSSNDDAVLVDEEASFYAVCDGTRGRFGGRTAGQLAVLAIQSRLAQLRSALPGIIDNNARNLVDSLVATAHAEIIAAQAADPELAGMATTYASIMWRGHAVLVSHVGDTRIYIWRDGALRQLTEDHNLEHYMKLNPQFKPKVKYPGKTLVRALGLKQSTPKVDHTQVTIQKDDLLLISTDGLTDATPEVTLATILSLVEINDITEIARSLVRAAMNHGTMDNVSLIVLHVTDRPAEGPRTAVFELDQATHGRYLVLGWLVFMDELHKGRVFPLDASTVVGADPGCKLSLPGDYVSSRHAEILRTQHGFVLRDLGSTNGTFINNIKVVDPQGLVDGDRVRMGRTEMIFKSYGQEG
jgi:serine/threonine protein phosphatase PrpC